MRKRGQKRYTAGRAGEKLDARGAPIGSGSFSSGGVRGVGGQDGEKSTETGEREMRSAGAKERGREITGVGWAKGGEKK